MSTDIFLLIGRKKLKLLYCQNKIDIREYEHENDAHIPFYFYSNNSGDILLGESAKTKYENQDKEEETEKDNDKEETKAKEKH